MFENFFSINALLELTGSLLKNTEFIKKHDKNIFLKLVSVVANGNKK